MTAQTRVSPNVPFMFGAAPSSRKTDMKNKTDQFMTDSQYSPAAFHERKIIAGDATIKGINTMILEHFRAGISHDEAANCYYEPEFSGQEKGVHYLHKAKMGNYLMAENVDTVTVTVMLHLGGSVHPYSFLHKVGGQAEVVLSILQPTSYGFQRRLTVAFAGDTQQHDDAVPIEAAEHILQGCHDWMFQQVLRFGEDDKRVPEVTLALLVHWTCT